MKRVVHYLRRLPVDMALRFSRYFGTSERFRLNLQNDIDIRNRKVELEDDLVTIKPLVSVPMNMPMSDVL